MKDLNVEAAELATSVKELKHKVAALAVKVGTVTAERRLVPTLRAILIKRKN